jgi:hypothetical protein
MKKQHDSIQLVEGQKKIERELWRSLATVKIPVNLPQYLIN